ncbi:chorismate--pyruvate lyase family protein [Pelomicrobium sp.]|jgi:chorismate--pyruvate lyase|uniref:chorismate--pyruvate lyase family protein n=1 Tax=Pelomicrobium sp. TaxID=2815319 RepID=UPI002FDCFDFC
MSAASRLIVWRGRLSGCPSGYRSWLRDRGSLTARLRRVCDAFRVQPLAQGLALPLPDERERLQLKPRERALVREVFLYCAEVPVVFAHSVAARRDLNGPWRRLSHLGVQPLGEALFTDPRVCRTPLEFSRLRPGDGLFCRASARLAPRPPELWARRSLFRLEGRLLLVTEVFLPGVLQLRP